MMFPDVVDIFYRNIKEKSSPMSIKLRYCIIENSVDGYFPTCSVRVKKEFRDNLEIILVIVSIEYVIT